MAKEDFSVTKGIRRMVYNPLFSKKEPPMVNRWRPAIAWSYVCICIFDFIIGPIFHSMMQAYFINSPTALAAWEPNTLKAGGLYHISMLAIIGVSAYGRTKEKIAGTVEEVTELTDVKR